MGFQNTDINMRFVNVLGALLLGSAVTLGIGGVLLFDYDLVPYYLVELTTAVVVALVPLSYYVIHANKLAINISTVLGIIAPISSIMNHSHLDILLAFGQGLLTSVLGLLQFFGFYLFPIVFVVLRIVYRKRLSFILKKRKPIVGSVTGSKHAPKAQQ
jgi:hypothetical protein